MLMNVRMSVILLLDRHDGGIKRQWRCTVQCSRCSREITEKQSYVSKGKVYCEDCLMDIGLNTRECDPLGDLCG